MENNILSDFVRFIPTMINQLEDDDESQIDNERDF